MNEKHYPVHIVSVGGFVENTLGQVLLIESPRYDDWEFPGGQVEEGETLTDALEREVLEETGIIIKVRSLVGIYSNTGKPSIVNIDFICEYVSGNPATSEESLRVEWVDRDKFLTRIKRDAIYGRMKNMLEFSGEITYRAYFVDPNRVDMTFKELMDRNI